MGFNLSGMARGFGQATEDAGMKAMQAAILDAVEERREKYATARDDKMIAHQSAEADKTRQFQSGENELNRNLTKSEGEAGRTVTREEGAATRSNQQTLADKQISANKEEHQSTREFMGGENEKNRTLTREQMAQTKELETKRIGLEGARLGLAKQQFGLAKQQAEIAIEAGQIDLGKKKELQAIEQQISKETDPSKLEALTGKYYTMLGKDKVIMATETDENGNKSQYPISSHTGQRIKQPGSGTGVDWSQFLGGQKQPGSTGGAAPSRAAQTSAPLIQEPPGSNRPGREDGLAARKRREIEDQKRRDQTRRDEYGDSGF